MLKTLGPELSREVSWEASNAPIPDGDLASLFAATHDIIKWWHYLPIYESALSAFRSRHILDDHARFAIGAAATRRFTAGTGPAEWCQGSSR